MRRQGCSCPTPPHQGSPPLLPCAGATHWGQQVFFMHPGIQVDEGNTIEGSLSMSRRSDNHRLMDVVVKHKV